MATLDVVSVPAIAYVAKRAQRESERNELGFALRVGDFKLRVHALPEPVPIGRRHRFFDPIDFAQVDAGAYDHGAAP